MNEILLSILMPVYNSQEFIKNSIKSVINQTLNNWELIIVNDGSKDKSAQVCDEFSKLDKRIKVIHQDNKGVSYTRNLLINNAKGKYIGFVDSDDYIDKDMFENLIKKIEIYDSDLVVCGIVEEKINDRVGINKVSNRYYPKDYMKVNEMDYLIFDYINSKLFNSLCNKLYKREIISKNNIKFNSNFENGEDFIFNLEYMKKINNLVFCEEEFYHYIRKENNSITHKYVGDMYEKGIQIHKELEKFLKDMGFYNDNNKNILEENHLKGVFFAILNLFHRDSDLNVSDKRLYIKNILEKDYVKHCAKDRTRDRGIIGLTSLLIRINSVNLIIVVFELAIFIRKFNDKYKIGANFMRKYIKKLIIENKFFQDIYIGLKHLITVPFYMFNYRIANPNLNIDSINNIIFIAHPDDEIISMGSFLINNSENTLVVCFTNGGNATRLNEFKNVMNSLNAQYQIWNFKDSLNSKWNEKKILKKINKILELKEDWEMVITHNIEGDYGHFQHKEVSRLVRTVYKGDNLFSPILSESLFTDENKLLLKESKEKRKFFERYYKSQKHILTLYNKYFEFEKIIKC